MKRCLFVDDSSVIRKVAKRILSGPEMFVIEASSGAEAIGICSGHMPDFILVDVGLPDMAADELVRALRSIPTDVAPRIAVCLTEMDVPAIMRSKRAGANGYLLKPFNRSQLLDKFEGLRAAA
ncbi:MAG: response regulator [Rhizobiaceae bacterium]|nr:response regulator [Rhizobiaceae bacterium]